MRSATDSDASSATKSDTSFNTNSGIGFSFGFRHTVRPCIGGPSAPHGRPLLVEPPAGVGGRNRHMSPLMRVLRAPG
jgi:hypothetical protein